MDNDDIFWQVEQAKAYLKKESNKGLKFWLNSKDFDEETEQKITRVVQSLQGDECSSPMLHH